MEFSIEIDGYKEKSKLSVFYFKHGYFLLIDNFFENFYFFLMIM